MEFRKNVGGLDRIARGVVGAALVGVAVVAVLAQRRGLGAVAALAGAGLLFNAATQFCGVNALLGIDTCSRDGP
ncbi:YgaP-like transmembrane domain [Halorussus halobius]|uniref:YgaP-like transmembrane domain n=1 Tax=Halorussus halobius TaxID=1710537 RepID=UPI001091D9A4|nr:YgaP-like transmembrane domain [Halorussus halobius]